MPHKIASDVASAASDVLPVEVLNSQVIALARWHARRRPLTSRINITKAKLPRLICPKGGGEKFYWDCEVPGLALRAYESGKRVWVLQYRDEHRRTRRLQIGRTDAIDPSAARKLAREALLKVAGGGDPSVERRKKRRSPRVSDLAEAYLEHTKAAHRSNTLDQTRRNLLKYAADLQTDAIGQVDRFRIHRLHQRIGNEAGLVQANRVLASLSAMWVWGLRAGIVIGENPCAHVPRFSEAERDRVLTADELRLIWACTSSGRDYDRIVRLLILTACRRQEVGSMQWSELQDALWTIPAARMKRGRGHEVPLSALALAQLPTRVNGMAVFGKCGTGFDGWSAAKCTLDRLIAKQRYFEARQAVSQASERDHGRSIEQFYLPSWGLHDLRRTFSTLMNDSAVAEPHIIEAVLAHQGIQAGIAGVYNKAAYREAKRTALANWAGTVTDIVGGC